MSFNKTLIFAFLLLVLTVVISLWAAPFLPDRVASHWDASGNVNGYQTRAAFMWTLPILMLVTAILLLFLPLIDPLKASFLPVRGTYYAFVIGLMVFLLYIHGLTIAYNLGYHLNLFTWMMPAMAGLMFATGFLLDRARPNWFVGIRTPWTLSSPTVWEKTHKLGGLLFKIVAGFILLGAFFPNAAFYLLVAPLLGISLFLVVYSYILFRQEQNPSHP
jgi:uncharacterized membrane protein